MLSRIEHAYLAILRIVVLVVATVALLVAIVAAATSLPALARQFGFLPTERPQGSTLAEYIDARKATAPRETAPGSAVATEPTVEAPQDVNAAAKVLQRYSKGVAGMTIPLWEQEIMRTSGNVPSGEIDRFYDQTRLLVEQLDKARGKRLDVPGLRDMLAWNAARFRDDATAHEVEKNRGTATALSKMYVASIAFVLFILVVFTFLFVKVERSLRLVRTVRLGETADA